MNDMNNFANLEEIAGRNFNDLKQKLMSISSPCKLIKITKEPTGKFSAVVMLDRPSIVKKKKADS